MPIEEIQKRCWVITGKKTAYVLSYSNSSNLINTYWGPRLPHPADYPKPEDFKSVSSFDSEYELMPEEFPVPKKMKFSEPCLMPNFNDGTRDLDLTFVSSHIQKDRLVIVLKDQTQDLKILLNYHLYVDEDVIKKWVVIKNESAASVHFDRIFSGNMVLPTVQDYYVTHLYGQWNHEFNRDTTKIPYGKLVLESRRLTSSHQHSPAVILHEKGITEFSGLAYFCVLGWSGNWKISVEKNSFGLTRVVAGINDFDFSWNIQAGQEFFTPPMYIGAATGGFHEVSSRLHSLVNSHLIPRPGLQKKVLYNSWEATQFEVDINHQKKLAQIAGDLGVELFVLDDGWFHGRKSDEAGLGDWWPDENKFPNGLKELSDFVHHLGMDFGLWIEPEMVNPDSDLYRHHPDWILHFPNREPTLARNQMILNITKPEVQTYLLDLMTKVINQTGVDFIKWDMNRNVSEPGDPSKDGLFNKQIWVRYTQSFYYLWDQLRAQFPQIVFQSCSGGGGRSDYGMLTRADQIWVSDNTDPTERLTIQDGFSLFYPASVMEAWVTDMGPYYQSLDYRFFVSMMGVLGIGADINRWDEDQKRIARSWISRYKEFRSIIQQGEQYRLNSLTEDGYTVVQYMNPQKTKGVLFYIRSYATQTKPAPMIYLRGLDEQANYRMDELNVCKSGAAWQKDGFQYPLTQNYSGQIFTIEKI